MKEYVLKMDLSDTDKGTRLFLQDGMYYYKNRTEHDRWQEPAIVENSPLVFEPEEEEQLTPEYLESVGFKKFLFDDDDPDEDTIKCDMPDVNYSAGDLVYFEKKMSRQQFVAVLTPMKEEGDNKAWYDVNVWVRHNVGCGMVQIPCGRAEFTVQMFQMLYGGIRVEALGI